MKKNMIIAVLAVAIMGFGGWVAYDKITSHSQTTTNNAVGNSNQVVQQQPTTENILDLSGRGLTKVGPEIYSKIGTTQLILSNNNLKTLPTELGKMGQLEVLKLDHNSLDGSLIGEIRLMPLRILDASDNKMTGVPAEMGQLNKLESLNLSNNRITGLPNELANLKNNLKKFDISGNPLSQDTINRLKIALPNTSIIF